MIERTVEIGSLALASGPVLERVEQRVTIDGTPASDGSNVVLVAHALTGNSHPEDWWAGLVGPGCLFDPARWAIVSVNTLGSCYGSTGPASPAPDGRPYGSRFPLVAVSDIVDAQARALDVLGIERIAVAIGGSLGGMQALDWGLRYSGRVDEAIVVGAFDAISAMGIALNTVAREAIFNDPNFNGGDYYAAQPPGLGLALARKIAMLSYKSDELFEERFSNKVDRKGGDPFRNKGDKFDVEGYLDVQGDRFVARMDANAYLVLTRAMDMFDARRYPLDGVRTAFAFVGIDSDWLFPAPYVRRAAERLARAGLRADYLEMHTGHGHDAFLAETTALASLLTPWMAARRSPAPRVP